MKRKLFILLALVLCLTPVLGLVACGSDADLAYGVKYIYNNSYVRSEEGYRQTYLIFDSNGYGKYHYYESPGYDYTIKFKYTYLDKDESAVACFFDSITYGEHHATTKDDDYYCDWSGIYTVSKNVIMSSSGSKFINKDYLNDEIKNYRKPKDND